MAVTINKNIGIATLVCGIIQSLLGLILLVCCIVFSAKIKDGSVVNPYWSAIPLMVSGGLAIACGITRNNCMLVAILIKSIIFHIIFIIATALSAIAAAFFGLYAKVIDSSECKNSNGVCYCDGKNMHSTCNNVKTIKTLLDCFAAFNALAAIVSLALAIIGCAGTCCYKESEGNVVHVAGGNTVIITTSEQQQQQQQQQQQITIQQPDGYAYPPQQEPQQPYMNKPPPYNDTGIIQYQPPSQKQ